MQFRSKFEEAEKKKIVEIACEQLYCVDGTEALNYLTNVRGFSQGVIEKFRLGYLPSYAKCDDGIRHELAGRIIIPIFDQYGGLIALSSRDWRKDAKMKFFHETFSKSFYLYGLNEAKHEIVKNQKVIIVEGEFDSIYLHAAGLCFTVGTIGSTLTLHQIALLSRYCREMYLLFDGDSAGKKAIVRAKKIEYENLLPNIYGINLIPTLLPDGVDPDDYVKSNGINKLIKLMDESKREVLGE